MLNVLKIPSSFLTIINDSNYKGYQAFFIQKIAGTDTAYVRIEPVEKIVTVDIKNIIFNCDNGEKWIYISNVLTQIKN